MGKSASGRRSLKAGVVLVAGGRSLRFGGKIPKQFLPLLGKPLLRWSFERFQESPLVSEVAVVLPKEFVEDFRLRLSRWPIRKLTQIVAGGRERFDSVRAGLEALSPRCRYAVVHDAARPLVSLDMIARTLRAARASGAAIAAVPVKDTVKWEGRNGVIGKTLDRNRLWLAQTPQVFQTDWLKRAFRKFSGSPLTDESQLFERMGKRVRLVLGSYENLKVTTPEDWIMAEALLKKRRSRR